MNKNMYHFIKEKANQYHQETIAIRRDIHQYAERGWLEMRTACFIASYLEKLGYEVFVGEEIMKKESRMGLPSQAILQSHYQRAKVEGANSFYLEKVKEGMTGVAGILRNGEGPIIALR